MPRGASVWDQLARTKDEQVRRLVEEVVQLEELFVDENGTFLLQPYTHPHWDVLSSNLSVEKKWVYTQVMEDRRNVLLEVIKKWKVSLILNAKEIHPRIQHHWVLVLLSYYSIPCFHFIFNS